nr:hypothetical protein [uncultured Sphingomonas sp.]
MPMLVLALSLLATSPGGIAAAPEAVPGAPAASRRVAAVAARASVRILIPARVGASYENDMLPGSQRRIIARPRNDGAGNSLHVIEFE